MPSVPRQQIVLIASILAVIIGVLAAGYFLFLRTPMVPAYQNVRQSDASAIIAELDKAGIPYRLDNDGHDVLVPENRASEARVAVAGSNVALGGTVGFELFDDSDMGLTEFAQKINFQRAMQGELSRTIMTMQGVEFARVHLALPERSIFRAGQGEPTAAVTVQMMPNRALSRQRIAGIQHLVASAVPGMNRSAVAVLDENGDLVSELPVVDNGYGAPLDERSALAQYYEARATDAIRNTGPGTRFEVKVNVRYAVIATGRETGDRAMPDRTDLTLDVSVKTAGALTEPMQDRIEATLADALSLDWGRGDTLKFTVGPVGFVSPPADEQLAARRPSEDRGIDRDATASGDWSEGSAWWPWIAVVVLIVLGVVLIRPRRRLDNSQALSFAEQLKTASLDREDAGAR